MKNFFVRTLNLRFMRIPLIFCSFFLLSFFCANLSLRVPERNLSPGVVKSILSSVSSGNRPYTEVFSLISLREKVTPSAVAESLPENTAVSTQSVLPEKAVSSPAVSINDVAESGIKAENYINGTPPFLDKGVSVLIVHTHTTESYTPSDKFSYVPSDTDRTLDKNFNMVRVGKEIGAILEKNGIRVQHDTTICDYPSYSGSYSRSGLNVQNAISGDPSIKIVLDVHRDAVEGKNSEKVKYTFTQDGKTGAQVMFVVGSNLGGLTHENWKTNMQFAATLQKHILSFYPDLMRPINFRSQRFNQQLAPGAIIVEVGTNGNTLDEALYGAQCFAEGLSDYINNYSD